MARKPKLHYFNGRGRMESIRWFLAAAGVEFEEELFETREEFEKLIQEGILMYEQVPMVEINGMNLVETRAILRYLAAKYDLYGRNLQEQACWPTPKIRSQVSKLLEDFLLNHPDFICWALRDHGQDFLVGDQLSWADIQLLEVILMAEECKPSVLAGFPLLQEFKARISYIPTIHKFLQPGSQRKPPLDEGSIETVKNIFQFERGMFLKNMGTIVAKY
ncbi:glutathione S-transferase A4-like [Neomonachus schauinslandi]|uniref:glutathione transferase n=1 Tax=Neomonachus schauinslandi TaxID=29088 RepID=A0A8M1MH37_NEOSC|nr:glutathione S-transferase A4-like [Neomonachus schauinslandi]